MEQEAYIRLMELSGDKNNRDNKNWRIEVAKNAALTFLKSNVRKHDRQISKNVEIDYLE